MVFDLHWFIKYQKILRWFANTRIGRRFFCIENKKSSVGKNKIAAILPNAIAWKNEDGTISAEFRTHDKFSKRLYYGLYPVWRLMHEWDRFVATPLSPSLDFGFATLTAFPVAGANSPCDGPVGRVGQNETFSTIQGGSGNQGGLETTASDTTVEITASTTSNQFAAIKRSGYNFDTSAIGSGQTISATVFSIVANFKTNGLGSDSYDCVDFNPSATNAIPAGAFVQFGSTSYANITYASLDTGNTNYNDWNLDSNGINNVSTSGISSFGLRSGWDRANSFGGAWSSGAGTRFNANYADQTGTTKDPKLVVTYTATATGRRNSLLTLLGVS